MLFLVNAVAASRKKGLTLWAQSQETGTKYTHFLLAHISVGWRKTYFSPTIRLISEILDISALFLAISENKEEIEKFYT